MNVDGLNVVRFAGAHDNSGGLGGLAKRCSLSVLRLPVTTIMRRSASAPKVSIISIQEVEEPESPRPRATHQFPSAEPAYERNSRLEKDSAAIGISRFGVQLINSGLNDDHGLGSQPPYLDTMEDQQQKLNYDYRKHLPEVESRSVDPVEEFEFISYLIDGPCEKPWLKERDPRV